MRAENGLAAAGAGVPEVTETAPSKSWKTEFISLEYDVKAVVREMDEEKLYEWAPAWYRITKALLLGGEISHPVALNAAMDLYKKKNPEGDWRDIPEDCWDEALRGLGL